MNGDAINPQHYQGVTVLGVAVQCIDVIEALDLGFHLGNALKYAWRFGRKHERLDEEIAKCLWYLDRWRSQGYEVGDVRSAGLRDQNSRPSPDPSPADLAHMHVELSAHLRNMCGAWSKRESVHAKTGPIWMHTSEAWMVELIELLGIEQQLVEHVRKQKE